MLHITLSRENPYELTNTSIGQISKLYDDPSVSKIIYIVPDQMIFETEKSLLLKLNKTGLIKIEVMSFAKYVIKMQSNIAKQNNLDIIPNDSIKKVIHKILLDSEDKLEYLKVSQSPSIIESVLNSILNFKTNNITVDDIINNKNFNKELLKTKLDDMCLVYSEYEKYLAENRYIDLNDNIKNLTTQLIIENSNEMTRSRGNILFRI